MNDELLEFCIYNIMYQLKIRNLDTSVTIGTITKYVEFIMDRDDILEEAYGDIDDESEIYDDNDIDDLEEEEEIPYIELWDKETEEITPTFIHDKIISFVNLNNDFFSIDSDSVVLNESISTEDLNDIFKEASIGKSHVYIDFILSNPDLLKIIGIVVRTDVANFLLDSEREIGKLYFGESGSEEPSLSNSSDNKEIIRKLKISLFKNIIWYQNTINNLTSSECLDIVYLIENYMDDECAEFPLHKNTLKKYDPSIIPKSPFLMSLFFYEEDLLAMSLVIKKIIQKKQLVDLHNTYDNEDEETLVEEKGIPEKNFYLAFLYFLDEEIKIVKEDEEFVSNLITIKYYLMMALDSVYGTIYF